MDEQEMPTAKRHSFWVRHRMALGFGALALVLVLAAGGYSAWRGQKDTPAQTVSAIASAAMKGDTDSVAASIDTTAIAESAVDEVFSNTDEQPAAVSNYLNKHPGLTEDQVKARVRATIDDEIRKRVESGALSERIPVGSDSFKALVAGAMALGSIRSETVEGDVAHVVVAVPYKGKTLIVQVRMQRSGDTWKIDQIENLADVLEQAGP